MSAATINRAKGAAGGASRPVFSVMVLRLVRAGGRGAWWRGLAFGCALLALVLSPARAAEVIPPPPRDHIVDQAGIVDHATLQQLDQELTQFERDTSTQLVVAIFPKMQSASSIEDYTVRVFQAWGVGQKGRNNGAVLFIFRDDRKVRIVTGYGLEGALPDARAKQIVENEITPRFRNGDFTGGVAAGTRAMMAAVRGEYQGTGQTVADQRRRGRGGFPIGGIFPLFIFLLVAISIIRSIFGRRNVVYGRRGRRNVWVNNTPWWGGGGGFGGGGGGGWSGGGGGSFSGGGGSTGGGGAGGSW